MHPAKSVIFFTTASGAGYGLLTLLLAAQLSGLISPDFMIGFIGFGIGFGLISAGLLSSTLHLGHPERAWRALTQWRTSWLSREGVMAIFTYIPTGIFALWWCFFPEVSNAVLPIIGLIGLIACLITVYCTAMIYASLKPIHAWCNGWVPIGYLILSLMTGAIILSSILHVLGQGSIEIDTLVVLFGAIGQLLKLGYWKFLKTTKSDSTAESATGLGKFGKVNLLEAPHTQNNYLLNEMGFKIARKHAASIRRLTVILGFIAPIALIGTGVANPDMMAFGAVASSLAVICSAIGIFSERWLFFAEAKHTVTLYYGASKV